MSPYRDDRARTMIRAWRDENPLDTRTWRTSNGGYVVQALEYRCHYSVCKRCDRVFLKVRGTDPDQFGKTRGHRWPERCEPCQIEHSIERDAAAKYRMRALRAARYAERDRQYARVGLKVLPGRPRKDRREIYD